MLLSTIERFLSRSGRLRTHAVIAASALFVAIAVALPSTSARANAASISRDEVLRECNVAAEKRWSGKYDFERNQRAVYAACMFSHGQPQ
jgi:hypothetical protein